MHWLPILYTFLRNRSRAILYTVHCTQCTVHSMYATLLICELHFASIKRWYMFPQGKNLHSLLRATQTGLWIAHSEMGDFWGLRISMSIFELRPFWGMCGPWRIFNSPKVVFVSVGSPIWIYSRLYTRKEWFSTFFRFSKIYTFLLIIYIFRRSIQKNRRISPCGKVFFFKKSEGP